MTTIVRGAHVTTRAGASSDAAPSPAETVTSQASETVESSPVDVVERGARPAAPADPGVPPSPLPESALLLDELMRDLTRGLEILKKMPSAVTFLGSARLKPGDEAYEECKLVGAKVAETGAPIRTGAGPGIMAAGPEGYIEERARGDGPAGEPQRLVPGSEAPHASDDDKRTQGFNIWLPKEQGVDDSIEHHAELKHFPYRKLMLFENARALVAFPGGYGTMDELFEMWAMPHRDPMLAFDRSFYGTLLDAVGTVARRERKLIDDDTWARVKVTDDAGDVARAVTHAHGVSGFEEPPDVLGARLADELRQAYDALDRLPPAIAFTGADNLERDDPAAKVLAEAARLLAGEGNALRVGGAQAVSDLVASATVESGGPPAQAFPLRRDGLLVEQGVEIAVELTDVVTQKHALTRGARGMVAGPGDIDALGLVFSLLCEVQCQKVPRVPIVLVGRDFWQPIFDALEKVMLGGERQLIAPEDLRLVTITDDPKEVAAAFAHAGAVPVPSTAAHAQRTSVADVMLGAAAPPGALSTKELVEAALEQLHRLEPVVNGALVEQSARNDGRPLTHLEEQLARQKAQLIEHGLPPPALAEA